MKKPFTFKKSITGGLSQVFNRYSEKDKTCIQSAEGLFVKVIKGWDSNSLYYSFLVDGFYQPTGPGDQPKGVIYEVHGCSVHFHNTDNCPIVSKIKSQKWKYAGPKRYKRTIERETLRHLGYEVVSIWECEIERMSKDDINFKKFLENRWKSSLKYKPSEQEILDSELTGKTYGFATVDIGVPSE